MGRLVLGRPGESQSEKSERTSCASQGGCAEPQPLFNGAGLYCLNCHASAIAKGDTYSSTAYLAPEGSAALGSVSDAINEMAPFQIEDTSESELEAELAPEFIERIPSSVFANLQTTGRRESAVHGV